VVGDAGAFLGTFENEIFFGACEFERVESADERSLFVYGALVVFEENALAVLGVFPHFVNVWSIFGVLVCEVVDLLACIFCDSVCV
jgi:hypothetical protein